MPIIERPVIDAVTVEIAAPATGLMLGRDKLGTGKLGGASVTWTPYLGGATEVDIKRGGKRSGVSLSIDVGTLTMTLLNVGDPRTDGAMRPNTPIRVKLKSTGKELFTGRLLDVDMTHVFDKTTATFNTYVNVTAVDGVTDHANTKRSGAIAPGGYETWETRIRRLSMSSRAPIAAPAIAAPAPLYTLASDASTSTAAAGWFNTGPDRTEFFSNPPDSLSTFFGTLYKTTVYKRTYYNQVQTNPAAATTWYDPEEGGAGMGRNVTGMIPGRMYRLRSLAGVFTDGVMPTAGVRANLYRLFVTGVGTGVPQRMPQALSVAYPMTFEFVARSTSATIGIELAERVNGLTGSGGPVEMIHVAEFVLEEIVSDGSQMLGSTIYESSLSSHFDLACASVIGGRWWVDAAGVTRFRAGALDTMPVASFSDVRGNTAAGAPLSEYVDVSTSFDSRNVVNDLTLKDKGTQLNDKGETVELETTLQVIEPTSIATWGTRSEEVEVTIYDDAGFAGALVRHASALLGQTASPNYTITRVEWNAAESPAVAGLLDVHSPVDVAFRGVSQRSRIISLNHSMTPTRHLVTIDLVRI